MDLSADAVLKASPDAVLAAVLDLGTYEAWSGIVHGASVADSDPSDAGPAWRVEIGAQVGPLRRTKALRMVRTHLVDIHAGGAVSFERRELDGRSHNQWILTGEVGVAGEGATLRMRLHYGGALWVPGLDRLLKAEIARSGDRLDTYLAG